MKAKYCPCFGVKLGEADWGDIDEDSDRQPFESEATDKLTAQNREVEFATVRCGAVAQPLAVQGQSAAVAEPDPLIQPEQRRQSQLTHKAASIYSKFSMLASDYGALASDCLLHSKI
jgi:hypothetical protein